MAPRRGFKPRTLALTVRCSIAELTRNLKIKTRLVAAIQFNVVNLQATYSSIEFIKVLFAVNEPLKSNPFPPNLTTASEL